MEEFQKTLVAIILSIIFLAFLLFALLSLSKSTNIDSMKNLFSKLLPRYNYLIITKIFNDNFIRNK